MQIHSIHIGQPQTITDENGTWNSSIFRQRVHGPIELYERGLAGDKVTDTRNHGKPEQAVCCHPDAHYAYWRSIYPDADLGAGSVGENWTLLDADESRIYIGDIYQVGEARVQVTGPRSPCYKQSRKLKIPNFEQRTIEALRTGFYMRVLEPGLVEAGYALRLEEQGDNALSIYAVNACQYVEFDPELAQKVADTPAAMPGWRTRFRKRLQSATE